MIFIFQLLRRSGATNSPGAAGTHFTCASVRACMCFSACMYVCVRVCVRRACICVHVFQTTLHLCVFTDRIFERLRGLRPSQRCVFVLSSQTPTDAFRCVRSRALFLDGFCLVFQSPPPFTRSLVLLQKGGCGLRGGAGGVMASWML